MYIPWLMCTQHPDSTIKATTAEEVEEDLNREGKYRIWPIVDMPRRLEGD